MDAIVNLEAILHNEKGKMEGGVHLQLCTAVMKAYREAKGLQKAHFGGDENDNSDDDDDDDEEEGEDSEAFGEERRETDMDVNELSELWGWQFDGGRVGCVLPLEGLIYNIVEEDEAKCVCAALRVIVRAVRGANLDDPADAERLLEWKEDLLKERAIHTCVELLNKIDLRGFHNEANEDEWMHSVICDEILELFTCLGVDDARFRRKMKREGVVKAVQEYAKERPHVTAVQYALDVVSRR